MTFLDKSPGQYSTEGTRNSSTKLISQFNTHREVKRGRKKFHKGDGGCGIKFLANQEVMKIKIRTESSHLRVSFEGEKKNLGRHGNVHSLC